MTRTALRAGQPLAAPLDFTINRGPIPTGQATTGSSSALSGTITASGSTNTKGSWTQLTAATDADVDELIVAVRDCFTSGQNSSSLMDIGIGGAGSEVVIIANIAVGYYGHTNRFPVPVIPKGTRIAARMQSASASRTASLYVVPQGSTGRRRIAGPIVTIGADTATSRGVSVTTPGSNNTKAAWTQITASTAQAFQGLALGVQGGGQTAIPDANALVDIGIGASGSEVVLVGNIPLLINSSELVIHLADLGFWPLRIPQGSRLAVRYQASAFGGLGLDAILYGVPA